MVTAIVHSATRVVCGLTTDQPPEIPEGFEAVTMPDDTDLTGGPYVVDGQGGLTPATEQQVSAAFVGNWTVADGS